VGRYHDLYRLLENVETNSVIDRICHVALLLGNPRDAGQAESVIMSFLSEEKEDRAVKLLTALAPFLTQNRQSKLREYIKILHAANLFSALAQDETLHSQEAQSK